MGCRSTKHILSPESLSSFISVMPCSSSSERSPQFGFRGEIDVGTVWECTFSCLRCLLGGCRRGVDSDVLPGNCIDIAMASVVAVALGVASSRLPSGRGGFC